MSIRLDPISYGPAGPVAVRRHGPPKWWYVVGVVLLLVSVGGAIGLGWSGMSIAIGKGIGSSITGTVAGAILVGLFGSLIAIVILVTTMIRSIVAQRRSIPASGWGGYPGSGPVMSGPPHM